MSNNPPHAVVELDEKTFNFIIKNCDNNITVGLDTLMKLHSRDLQESMIELIEEFKALKAIVQKGKL